MDLKVGILFVFLLEEDSGTEEKDKHAESEGKERRKTLTELKGKDRRKEGERERDWVGNLSVKPIRRSELMGEPERPRINPVELRESIELSRIGEANKQTNRRDITKEIRRVRRPRTATV